MIPYKFNKVRVILVLIIVSVINVGVVVAGFDNSSRHERWNYKEIDTARNVSYLTDAEKNVVLFTNMARCNPSLFAKKYLNNIKNYNSATRECYEEMIAKPPLAILIPSSILARSAKDHAIDTGKNGIMGHIGSDGSDLKTRIDRYGRWDITISENCIYCIQNPLEMILAFLIDEDVPDRGHRRNLLNPRLKYIGVSIQPHKRFGIICVQDFAGMVKDKEELINLPATPNAQ